VGQKGPSNSTQNTQAQLTQEQISLAQQQDARAQQIYSLTEPGLQSAEDFYKQLASGNSLNIQRATSPATERIASAYNQAAQNISTTMPRGGARDLALQESEISKAGQIGGVEANAYLGSFPALASLAQGGIGLSINEVTQALSAFSGASSSNQALGQMQGAGKAQTLAFVGGLGQSAAQGAGLAMSCWIAEALWGPYDLHTIRLRAFLNGVYSKTWTGRMFMWCYRHCGQFVARQARAHSWVRRLLMPLFRRLDRMAQAWEQTWADFFRTRGAL
jgi:hypothetical protein